MQCPGCGKDKLKRQVVRTVTLDDEIMRSRVCEHCGHKWTTAQRVTLGRERIIDGKPATVAHN